MYYFFHIFLFLFQLFVGRWDIHRERIGKVGNTTRWEDKIPKVFFRGSRTCSERDALILLSRENPDLADAQYTKNQAWKSDMVSSLFEIKKTTSIISSLYIIVLIVTKCPFSFIKTVALIYDFFGNNYLYLHINFSYKFPKKLHIII